MFLLLAVLVLPLAAGVLLPLLLELAVVAVELGTKLALLGLVGVREMSALRSRECSGA